MLQAPKALLTKVILIQAIMISDINQYDLIIFDDKIEQNSVFHIERNGMKIR